MLLGGDEMGGGQGLAGDVGRPARRLQVLFGGDAADGLRDGVDEGGGVAAPEVDLGGEEGAVVEARRILDDGVAHLLQEPGRGRDGGGDFGIDGQARPGLGRDGDAQAAGGLRDLRQIGRGGARDLEGIADGRALDGVERGGAVAHACA